MASLQTGVVLMVRCDTCGNYYKDDTCKTCEFGKLGNTGVNSWAGLDIRPSENANLNVENDDY
jgi:hypothetical protein